ncbi:hypothetical protein IKQ19_09915 [Candidatus Saccharibacteria bacterium]|nr:hypothetical protein [Candidatus Saccharibacteria bacterium]
MRDFIIPLISGIGAIVAAIITSMCMLKNANKKRSFESVLKIAEFRQQWINDLRNSMAEFQSYGALPGNNPTRIRDFYLLGTKIELLMNPDDEDYGALHETLEAFYDAETKTENEKFSVDEKYVKVCQRILKREWERLKKDVV